MGSVPCTLCAIPCGCCTLGLGCPPCQVIIGDSVGNNGTRNIKPPVSTSDAFNADFCQRRDRTIENKHMRSTVDSWSPRSLDNLITLLKDYCSHKHPIEQIWIIFYWISQNISYDAISFLNKHKLSQTPTEVFQKRNALCGGYASLFSHLCSAIGQDTVVISGYSRGLSHPAKGKKLEVNHAWNAVHIGSFWYLLDCTWGTGGLDGKNFNKRLEPHFFLTRPENFIYSHLPRDKNWQLLQSPIGQNEFLALPKVSPAFFELQLKLADTRLTNTVHLKSTESFVEIAVNCPPDILLLGSMTQKGRTIDNSCFTNYHRKDKTWHCLFAPQRNGWHKLIVCAKRDDRTRTFCSAVEFSLDAPNGRKPMKFPNAHQTFIEKRCCLYEPLSSLLRKGSQTTIHCLIPKATRVAVILDGKNWVFDDNFKDSTMNISITVPQNSITISAQFSDSGMAWHSLLKYDIE